jgi:hypothetical protein
MDSKQELQVECSETIDQQELKLYRAHKISLLYQNSFARFRTT